MRPRPSLYLDECVDVSVVGALREQGFVVTTALAEQMLRVGDDQQLAFAAERDLLRITHNQRHFWRWHSTFLRGVRTPDSCSSPVPLRWSD